MKGKNKRPTIGILIDLLDGHYSQKIWPSMRDRAAELGMNVVFFIGRSLYHKPFYYNERNRIFDLAKSQDIDGLVVSAAISAYITDEVLDGFLSRYGKIPVVCVGRRIGKGVSVLVDNKSGMRAIVDHMIEEHNCQTVAFLRGPEDNDEAEERFAAYRESLQAHGIAYNPALVEQAGFRYDYAAQAAERLINRGLKIDAIVAANDEMGTGAFDTLQAKGYKIPQDIRLAGFDNIAQTHPPEFNMSTVAQPYSDMGVTAMETMFEMLSGHPVEKQRFLKARPILRHTCGCGAAYGMSHVPQVTFQTRAQVPLTQLDFDTLFEEALKSGENMAPSKEDMEAWKAFLSKALSIVDESSMEQYNEAIGYFFAHFLEGKVSSSEWLERWQEIISSIRRQLEKQNKLTTILEKLLKDILYLLQEKKSRFYLSQLLSITFWTSGIRVLFQNLHTSFELIQAFMTSLSTLSNFNINYCYVALFQKGNGEEADETPRYSRLFGCYKKGEVLDLSKREVIFPTLDLIPDGEGSLDEMGTALMFPLTYKTDHFGFVFMNLSSSHPTGSRPHHSVYELIAEQFTNFVKFISTLEELELKNKEQTILNSNLERLSLEKSKFLANMSHELRTPLNSINGVTELLSYGAFSKREEIYRRLEGLKTELMAFGETIPGQAEAVLRDMAGVLEREDNLLELYFRRSLDSVEAACVDKPRWLEKIKAARDDIMQYVGQEERETNKAYQTIRDSGNYLISLIDTILNISKLEAGRMDVMINPVNMDDFLRFVLTTSESYAKSKSKEAVLRLVVEKQANVGKVYQFDRMKVQQIILNLMSNAVKFTVSGTITLTVREETDSLLFSVRDEGIGIKLEEQQRIFTEFGRSDAVKDIEGTGLGLALSRKLVHLHGGTIGFQSDYGKGSLFWFKIPKMA